MRSTLRSAAAIALALSAGAGGGGSEPLGVERGPRAVAPPLLFGGGSRFDPHWWVRKGARRNQRERRRDRRRRSR